MEAVKTLKVQPRRTPWRKRAWNVQKVTTGTGKALPGRSALRGARTSPSFNRGGAGRGIGGGGGVGGGRSPDRAERKTEPPVRKGRCVGKSLSRPQVVATGALSPSAPASA